MGITGLLPFLEKATKPCHIAEFRGGTVVVDTYCWLHKGANACAVQLAQGEESSAYVHYCLKYVKMLQSYDIRPILVFDGKNLPAKAETETKRRESRAKAKQRAAELLRLGKTDEARTYLKQCINITPDMASALIKECHKMNVDCIVAPYESDAQLAFFNIKGIAEVVITEDSDLILFGCTKVLYKLDLNGCGYLVEAEKIPLSMKLRPDRYSFDKFRYMCILSGCDYVDSLQGIGLKKALKFFSLTDETNPEIFLGNVPRYLNMRHLQISDEYKANFMKANATFLHQIVFDPFKKKLMPLYDPETCGTNPKFCENAGEVYDHQIAYQVALGNLHPTTHKQLDNWNPEDSGNNSIWSGVYKKTISRKEQKAAFKSFFQKQPTESNLAVCDDEEVKSNEDKKIKDELAFYMQKPECKKEVDSEKENNEFKVEHKQEEKKSPLLKSNPFIKRFSKFPRTQTNTGVIVKSRYFSSNSSEQVEDAEHDIQMSSLKTEDASPNIQQSSMDTEDASPDIQNTSMDTEDVNPGIQKSFMETKYVNADIQKSFMETEDIKAESLQETKKYLCDINDTAKTLDVDISDSEDETVSLNKSTQSSEVSSQNSAVMERSKSQEIPGSSSTKRKQIGSCRSVGLKKPKCGSNQQKISSYFDKFRKK